MRYGQDPHREVGWQHQAEYLFQIVVTKPPASRGLSCIRNHLGFGQSTGPRGETKRMDIINGERPAILSGIHHHLARSAGARVRSGAGDGGLISRLDHR